MKIRIGENIRRLRKAKGLTQEQLAELMNVSCAAVSKWESADTYPDITMIFPLANLFDVSTDELMGYDSERIESEIDSALEAYRQLDRSGKFREASEHIASVRSKYPNDFRVMNAYMWDIAGGCADNSPDVLNRHSNELMRICDCILDGCTVERIRLEAVTMKAKLYHAMGNTPAALGMLESFPSWYQSAEQKTEQLFAKDTPEFRYWVRRNLYELAGFTANKLIKTIWYDGGDERISKCEAVGDMFTEMSRKSDETVYVIMEQTAFSELASKITNAGGNISDIIRIREKSLCAAGKLAKAAENDDVLKESLIRTYNCADPLGWIVNWLKTSQQETIAKLRENVDYMNMLDKFSK